MSFEPYCFRLTYPGLYPTLPDNWVAWQRGVGIGELQSNQLSPGVRFQQEGKVWVRDSGKASKLKSLGVACHRNESPCTQPWSQTRSPLHSHKSLEPGLPASSCPFIIYLLATQLFGGGGKAFKNTAEPIAPQLTL